MELGNMFFGHSRGKYPIDRDIFQDVFFDLFIYECNFDSYGYTENGKYGFENDVFKIMPYDWNAECDCGFEQLEKEYWKNKKHNEDCYQKLIKKELIENDWIYDEFGYLEKPQNMSYSKADKIENNIRKKYCKQFNLSYPEGCAVHCTCGFDESYSKWLETNYHKDSCRLLKPNFFYKPTGFQIMWYKYPLRDSYMNQNITVDEFKEILTHCTESYKKVL